MSTRKISNATRKFFLRHFLLRFFIILLVQQWSPLGEIRSKESIVQKINETAESLSNAFIIDQQPEDLIYNLFKLPNKEEASIGKLLSVCFPIVFFEK